MRSRLAFGVTPLDYADLPRFGPDHLLARLAASGRVPEGFPLLRRGAEAGASGSEYSESEFSDGEHLASILAKINGRPVCDPGEEVRFVVTGQQTGLLTGPLYSFLKAATAIRLAADLEAASGVRHVPLFWMASEDHDLLEVNRCRVNGKLFVAGSAEGSVPSRRPQVADVPLSPHREELLAFLDEALPLDRPAGREVRETVASCPFDSYPAFFQALMVKLFRDRCRGRSLHFVDPLPLRPLTAPVLARLVERWPETVAALDAGTGVLRSHGFAPPLSEPGLFEIVDGARIKVAISAEGAALSTGPCSLEAAAETIRRHPGRFSPNAALRPVLQDATIPVAATVGGPSELLYLWQIDALFGVAGVRRSSLRPRISATFIEPAMRRAARRFGLAGAEIFTARALLEKEVRPGGEESRERSGGAGVGTGDGAGVGGCAEAIAIDAAGRKLVERLDRFLEKSPDRSVERSRRTIASQLEKVTRRIGEVEAARAGVGRKQLEKLAAGLLPGGGLQERTAGVIEFVARHGPEFVTRTLETLDPWTIAHFAVEIDPAREKENQP